MEPWLTIAGACCLTFVVGWLLDARRHGTTLRRCAAASTVSAALMLLLILWRAGDSAAMFAAIGLPVGAAGHRSWLGSLVLRARM